MANSVKGSSSPVFNRGIETIVREQQAPRLDIPAHQDALGLAPSETLERPHLDQLFSLQTYDEFIAAELLPLFSDPRIVTPQRFRAVLERMPRELREIAERKPSAGRALGRAARVLAESISMHELLQMYVNALIQG